MLPPARFRVPGATFMADAVIEITGIGAGGAGVGRLPDGRVTFVHRTAPGDEVAVRVREDHGSWTRSELVQLRRPSPDRREAPCPYYDRCGGCTLEHLEYAAQLRAKREVVRETVRRIGGLELEVPDVVPSPEELRYRNRVTFTLKRLRHRVVAGFHELDRPGRIVDVGGDCLLAEPAVSRIWSGIRDAWGDGARRLPSGRELRLTVRATTAGRGSLLVEGGRGPGRLDLLVDAVPELDAAWQASDDEPPVRVAGDDVSDRWLGVEVGVDGAAFLQVNRSAAALLEAHVLGLVRDASPGRVVDAYCGVGLRAGRLAGEGIAVVGIETDALAVREARRGAPDARFVEGRVEDRLGETLPADMVILNPPRAGLARQVTVLLEQSPPRRIVYVSCDPATLARDLKRLGPAFRHAGVRSFDLFPQTAHVETVVELTCATT